MQTLNYLCLMFVIAGAYWQLLVESPLLPPWATGALMLVAGLLAGIRIGYGHADRLVRDAIETNLLLQKRLHAAAVSSEPPPNEQHGRARPAERRGRHGRLESTTET